eukprot:contig_1155_g155
MDPVCVYLRLFDGQSSCLCLVLPATPQLQAEMASLEVNLRGGGVAGTASSVVFSQVFAVMNKRVAGPSDRSVRVLLLTDLHYLEGALDPKVFGAQAANAADIFERSCRAISQYCLKSPQVFSSVQVEELSDYQRMQLLKEELTSYAALS